MRLFSDLRVILLLTSVSSGVMFFYLLFILKNRKIYDGFQSWTMAAFCSFLATMLFTLRGYIPDVLSIVCANAILVFSYMLVSHGIILFSGRNVRTRWFLYLPITVLALGVFYWTYVMPSLAARIVITNSFGLAYFLVAWYMLVRYTPQVFNNESVRSLSIIFMLASFFFLVRVVCPVIRDDNCVEQMQYSVYQGLLGLVLFIFTQILYIGLLLLNSRRIGHDLEQSIGEVKVLQGMLPICSYCKKIRDSEGYWKRIEEYIMNNSEAEFSHGICEECAEKHFVEYDKTMDKQEK